MSNVNLHKKVNYLLMCLMRNIKQSLNLVSFCKNRICSFLCMTEKVIKFGFQQCLQIGRASCRERVKITELAVSVMKICLDRRVKLTRLSTLNKRQGDDVRIHHKSP